MQTYSTLGFAKHRFILKMRLDIANYEDSTQRILSWAISRENRYVCAANVHMVMEAYDSSRFAKVINDADLVTSDGMPLVWALRLLGVSNAMRVYGPTLMLHVCEAAAKKNIPIGLYGGTPQSLAEFVKVLENRFIGIQIACQIAPPFRTLKASEKAAYAQQIRDSGAQILFVGIGCPKQEYWMAEQHEINIIQSVMIGVGAAFDFHSGKVKQAPQWIQNYGLEWLFRLNQEPRRLWKRYAYHNPRFVVLFFYQWLQSHINVKKNKG
jgi:N-acetylglucosaminyldiphosphoundecaprenol N-acetyl-beta-D-mannosaminyltransferase